MRIDIVFLLAVAFCLWQASRILEEPSANPLRGIALWSQIGVGIARVLFVLSIASISAAVILVLVPIIKNGEVGTEDLKTLNEAIEHCNTWMERSWIFLLSSGLTLLASIRLGWIVGSSLLTTSFAQVVRVTRNAQFLVGVLASFSIVGGGVYERATIEHDKALLATERFRQLQLEVFSAVEPVVQHEVVSAVVAEMAQVSPVVTTAMQEYRLTAPYLPTLAPVRERAVQARQADPEKSTTQFVASEGMSVRSTKALRNEINGLSEADFMAIGDLDPDPPPPPAGPRTQEKDAENADGLVEDVSDILFEQTVFDPLKRELLNIENPVLNELFGTLFDPLIAEPINKAVTAVVLGVLDGRVKFAKLKESAQSAARAIGPEAARQLTIALATALPKRSASANPSRSKSSGQDAIGEPHWNAVRQKLSAAVAIGIADKPKSTQIKAREEIARFEQFWEALPSTLPHSANRQQMSEHAFLSWAHHHPEYAALWGYAVITFPPAVYRAQLREQTLHDHKMGTRIKAVRAMLMLRDSGNSDMESQLEDLGLKNLPPGVELTDDALAKEMARALKAYPIDGFLLYAKATSTDPEAEILARRLYETNEVAESIDRYCRRDSR